MPNHVTNLITFDCSARRFQEIAEFVRCKDDILGSVDFNKVLPMPKSLEIECGSRGNRGYELYKEYLSSLSLMMSPEDCNALKAEYLAKVADDPEVFELGKQYYENQKEYGATTWYDWSIYNWGTKWNAYDCIEVDADSKYLQFNTAWSSVPNILALLSEEFPEVRMEYKWADENIGYNVGTAIFYDGELQEYDVPNGGSKEAYELAAEVLDFDLADWGFALTKDGSTYEYVGENLYVNDAPEHSSGEER